MLQFTSLVEKLVAKMSGGLESLVVILPNLALAALVLGLGVMLSRWAKRVTHRVVLRVTKNEPISQLLATLARVGLVLLAALQALSLLELEKTVTSLVAGVGVVGLALGFAFQDIAANFMSGIIMALSRPFDVEDLVEVAGQRGTVKRIALRAAELQTLDGLSCCAQHPGAAA